jgi:hypothetical protein
MTFPDLDIVELFDTRAEPGCLINSRIDLDGGFATLTGSSITPDSLSRAPGVTVQSYSAPAGMEIYSQLFMREMRRTSFSGAFTYYIPQSPRFLGNYGRYVAELDRVIGLSLNPTNAWQLTPWSWLVDWFVDVRSNLDLIELTYDDNLVVNYGYGMQTSTRTAIAKTQIWNPDPSFGLRFCSTKREAVRKRRVRANPYGFITSTSGDWSPYRWSILAALGLTKL